MACIVALYLPSVTCEGGEVMNGRQNAGVNMLSTEQCY